MPTRVLVVDDSAFMRKALGLMLGGDPSIEVVGTASNGEDALSKIAQLKPDVVTLDIEMPVMDGLTALSKIRLLPEPRPAVLVCSTLTSAGSQAALRAMRLGAADFLCKDPDAIGAGNEQVRRDMITRVRMIAPATKRTLVQAASAGPKAPTTFAWHGREVDLVVVGSSTGGPPVLEQLLAGQPADFPAPIVVAQHMPAMFTKSMSERLAEVCDLKVRHAEADCLLEAGTAYITVGGKHSRVHRMGTGRLRLEVSDKPAEALYKPSVNELFASAGAAARERCLGVMLTGMGDDGCAGARVMHKAGAILLAQRADTCAVYGMPRAVVEAGLASAVLDPAGLGQAMAQLAPSARGKGTPGRKVA